MSLNFLHSVMFQFTISLKEETETVTQLNLIFSEAGNGNEPNLLLSLSQTITSWEKQKVWNKLNELF